MPRISRFGTAGTLRLSSRLLSNLKKEQVKQRIYAFPKANQIRRVGLN